MPSSDKDSRCHVVRRAGRAGRDLIHRQASLLDGLDLCNACAKQVRLSGLPGAYLTVARHMVAARHWLHAFEAADVQDWPTWISWTARTPFDASVMPAAIAALARDEAWEFAARAALAAWSALARRAEEVSDLARCAAGQPGLPAHAAAACAIAAAHQDTYPEAHLISAISAPDGWGAALCDQGWTAAAQAWEAELRLDADLAAARAALADALEFVYRDARVRDVSLLPPPARRSGADFVTPAGWADEEYKIMQQAIARQWAQRLEDALASVLQDDEDAASRWRLLLITGWPLTASRDQELAYLARYPEIACVEVRPEIAMRDREHIVRSTVLLHVPGFAARHAVAHASPFFIATASEPVPRGVRPASSQIARLVKQAARIHLVPHPAGRAR